VSIFSVVQNGGPEKTTVMAEEIIFPETSVIVWRSARVISRKTGWNIHLQVCQGVSAEL